MSKYSENELLLGKDISEIVYSKKPKKFRKDGSQTYDYFEAKIFGRQLIDTFFLSIKYDIARKYESYGLKQIISQEGLEKKDRTKWDFEKIMPKEIWDNYSVDWVGEAYVSQTEAFHGSDGLVPMGDYKKSGELENKKWAGHGPFWRCRRHYRPQQYTVRLGPDLVPSSRPAYPACGAGVAGRTAARAASRRGCRRAAPGR